MKKSILVIMVVLLSVSVYGQATPEKKATQQHLDTLKKQTIAADTSWYVNDTTEFISVSDINAVLDAAADKVSKSTWEQTKAIMQAMVDRALTRRKNKPKK